MVSSQELLDTFVPHSYNPSNYRINLKGNVISMKKLVDELKQRIPGIIISLLSLLFGTAIYHMESYIPIAILEKIKLLTWAKLTAWLTLIALILISYVVYLHNKISEKINFDDYIYLETPWCYRSKIDNHWYCNPCLTKGIKSRLSQTAAKGIFCRICQEIYLDPSERDKLAKQMLDEI